MGPSWEPPKVWGHLSTFERAMRDMMTYSWIETRNTEDGLHNINCYCDPDNGQWLCHPHCVLKSN